jgi:cytochrome c-type biogenesis protein CcmH/NrfF
LRTERRLGSFLVLAAFVVGPALRAQNAGGSRPRSAAEEDEHGHAAGDDKELEDFSAAEKARVFRLFGLVVCACPKENWTKSLAGCPDGCAIPQKDTIKTRVKAGKSDEEILAEQVERYGPEVLARPPFEGLSGFTIYVLPFLVLAALTVVVLQVLKRAVKPAPAAGPSVGAGAAAAAAAGAAPPKRALSDEERRIGDAIERELQEME